MNFAQSPVYLNWMNPLAKQGFWKLRDLRFVQERWDESEVSMIDDENLRQISLRLTVFKLLLDYKCFFCDLY